MPGASDIPDPREPLKGGRPDLSCLGAEKDQSPRIKFQFLLSSTEDIQRIVYRMSEITNPGANTAAHGYTRRREGPHFNEVEYIPVPHQYSQHNTRLVREYLHQTLLDRHFFISILPWYL